MSTGSGFVARHKKPHKPQAKTQPFWDALKRLIKPFDVIGVRGAYYQAEMAGVVGKTDADYDKVQRALLAMRRAGVIPYDKICDNSRERRSIYQYGGLRAALEEMQRTYRRNYWLTQPTHVEIWCEKDALTPVINPVCQRYGVTFCAIRGFDSETFTYVSSQDLKAVGKPAVIYYFGDHDPSGWFLAKGLQDDLRRFGAEVWVYPVAVKPAQVAQWNLPTRRAKRTDSRYAAFVQEFGSDLCTEVDAIPPTILRQLVEECIRSEIDFEMWARTENIEDLERETLENVLQLYGDVSPGTVYQVGA